MSDHNLRKTRLDDAIDNAVRDIMQLDPRSGLRRRVISQLGAPVQSSSSWMPRVLVPVGALTCILAAVFVLSSRERSAPVVATSPVVGPVTVPAAPAAVASTPAAPATVTALRPSERIPPSRSSRPRLAATPATVFGPRTGRVAAASVPPVPGAGAEAADGALRPLPPLVLPGLVIPPLDLPALTPVKKDQL